jgi:hypothetical protein
MLRDMWKQLRKMTLLLESQVQFGFSSSYPAFILSHNQIPIAAAQDKLQSRVCWVVIHSHHNCALKACSSSLEIKFRFSPTRRCGTSLDVSS